MESDRKIENFETQENFEIKNPNQAKNQANGGQLTHQLNKENDEPNKENKENNIRRHDEPSKLSFEICK